MNVYFQAKKLRTLRTKVKELSLKQTIEKKQLSEKSSRNPAYLQHKIDIRRNQIDTLHSSISLIKDKLKLFPRGSVSYEKNIEALNEYLNEQKSLYNKLAAEQYNIKKMLTSVKNFDSPREHSKAQSQKMKNKEALKELSLEKAELKQTYKYLSDRIYRINTEFAKQRA